MRRGRLAARLIAIAALGVSLAAADPQPRTRVRLGGVSVGAGYSYAPGFWPYYPAFWGPYGFYGPVFHPGYYDGFVYRENMGEVRLRVEPERAEVFLDGAYAGTARERKSMWLAPGAYLLEVKADGRAAYSRKVYVLSGKSLRIDAALEPESTESQP
jgi:hypothetical protein